MSSLEPRYFGTFFSSSHECVECVCEQAQLTEVSTKQQIGVYRRSPEGLSTVVNLAVSEHHQHPEAGGEREESNHQHQQQQVTRYSVEFLNFLLQPTISNFQFHSRIRKQKIEMFKTNTENESLAKREEPRTKVFLATLEEEVCPLEN